MMVHEGLAHALLRDGHRTMFGLIGDANLFMVEQFVRRGGRYVAAAHEAGAVLMANGWASVSGDVAIATVTHGPAVTNTVTALVEAARSRLPVVLIAGDTAAGDRKTLQDIGQQAVFGTTGAHFIQARPDRVLTDLNRAIAFARRESRPVCLNVPVDVQWLEVAPGDAAECAVPVRSGAPTGSATSGHDVLEEAAAVAATARRPVVLAGRGAIGPDARRALISLADALGAPLATTLRARDLFRGLPNDLGICGTLSTDETISTLAQSDCILAFGASLSPSTTDGGALFADKAIVRCDLNPTPTKHAVPTTVMLRADAEMAAWEIRTLLGELDDTGPRSPWHSAAVSAPAPTSTPKTDDTLTVAVAARALDEALDPERTVVVDLGRFAPTAMRAIHVTHPSAYVHTASFGSIGLGMGNAIGAAFARPQRPVLLVTGDGGFMHGGLAEFHTAVRYGLDIVVAVMNDRAYTAELVQFVSRSIDPSLSRFDWPSFAAVARAMGGHAETICAVEELRQLPELFQHRAAGPMLLDIRIAGS